MFKPPARIRDFLGVSFFVAFSLIVSGCAAVSVTVPLSDNRAEGRDTFGLIYLTSGTFQRPHQIIGIVQMTQEGYRWLHENEVITEANPDSILYKIGAFVRGKGAEGIQHLVVIDANPQTSGEKTAKQIITAIKVVDQVRRGRAPTALSEGTRTKYLVRGELVKFTN